MPKLETLKDKIISGVVLVVISCLVTYAFTSGGKASASDLNSLDKRVLVLEEQNRNMKEWLSDVKKMIETNNSNFNFMLTERIKYYEKGGK